LAIPMNTPVKILLMSGEQVEGEVAMVDQTTYLCLRRDNETLYLPWSAIKCVRGPILPERGTVGGAFVPKVPGI
jgi:small nuclear ribonucleoprotein (snRNP)-like protein